MGFDLSERLWGEVPAGFVRTSKNNRIWALVRQGLEDFVGEFFAGRGKTLSPFHGRDRLSSLRLKSGEALLVRAYRHGGLLRNLTGDFFFTWPPRPFCELVITEEARRRGIPTVEIVAAWIERSAGPFYRGWLATRELTGARDLWAILQGGPHGEGNGREILESVARCLRIMHSRGLYHRDLNLRNILVRDEEGEIKSYIIDLDKAKLFPDEVPPNKAQKNLDRLFRSLSKLDARGRFVSREDWNLLLRFYQEAEG